MDQSASFEKTRGFAEAALGHLKRHQLDATPKNFEFWYSYSAGFHRPLNRAVNDILRARGRITADELQNLHATFLSQGPLGDRIEEIGGRVASEISEIAASIGETLAETAAFATALALALDHLATHAPEGELASALEGLARATERIAESKRRLTAQLTKSTSQLSALQSNLESIRYESLNDPLTTLSARKHFDHSIERAVADAAVDDTPMSLMITDIDHFKSFNDRYGHQTGDQVLQLVAVATKQNIKGQAVACRYGGEEFAIILPSTGSDQAFLVAESIREAVSARELVKRATGENLGHITISIGIATYRPGDTPQSMIERADACLYAAKRAGRNRVVSDATPGSPERHVA